ncbi:hypothetical protein B4135_0683 [Caldibacillus debilis]|uniref:Uncharacterized protein n=1 Tax=Caldibacillus debilis TaxID=301148 RepID=A0A150LPU6_9BACI|nr:hypothetical protein B4135_0683 [Caldibacillus debilis]
MEKVIFRSGKFAHNEEMYKSIKTILDVSIYAVFSIYLILRRYKRKSYFSNEQKIKKVYCFFAESPL